MFWGMDGQNIFVDPLAKVVIVHTGNSPKAGLTATDIYLRYVMRSSKG